MKQQKVRAEIVLLQESLKDYGHFAAAELLDGHLAEFEEDVSPSRADVLLEGAQAIVNAVESPLGVTSDQAESAKESWVKELESIFPDFVESAQTLAAILEREEYDDILPEAKELAATIESLNVEIQAVKGNWSDDLKQRAGALIQELTGIAEKVFGVSEDGVVEAFEEAFQQLKARRDRSKLH